MAQESLRDIKPLLDSVDPFPYWILWLLFIVIALFFIWQRLKPKPKTPVDPWMQLNQNLEKITSGKEAFSQLSIWFRSFFELEFNESFMQSTVDEILHHPKIRLTLHPHQIEELETFFSDFEAVVFAGNQQVEDNLSQHLASARHLFQDYHHRHLENAS